MKSYIAAHGGGPIVTFDDWLWIDAEELRKGAALGKPREKFVSVKDMLAV